ARRRRWRRATSPSLDASASAIGRSVARDPRTPGAPMFDHVVVGVSDYEASKAFFVEALAPLGVAVVQEGPLGVELAGDDKASFCLFQTHEKPARLHVAFAARTRQQVEA